MTVFSSSGRSIKEAGGGMAGPRWGLSSASGATGLSELSSQPEGGRVSTGSRPSQPDGVSVIK